MILGMRIHLSRGRVWLMTSSGGEEGIGGLRGRVDSGARRWICNSACYYTVS